MLLVREEEQPKYGKYLVDLDGDGSIDLDDDVADNIDEVVEQQRRAAKWAGDVVERIRAFQSDNTPATTTGK